MFSQGLLEAWSDHLNDLRKTFIRIFLLWIIATAISFFFSQQIFDLILSPLQYTPLADQDLLLLTPTDGVVALLKVVTTSGLVLAFPLILIVLWQFISPGLKANEKRFLSIYVMTITIVVYASIVYGFFFDAPL
jgi:sec-independent protein translocase protein TatC